MDNDTDEPEWLGFGSSLMSAAVLLIVFGIVIPFAILLLIDLIDIGFMNNLSMWVLFPIFCIIPSMLVLLLINTQHPVGWSIPAGCVQFVKNGLPGDLTAYKLDGGFHILLPFFIKWREPWSYDEKWEVSISDYRVSLKGTSDVMVSAEATVVPMRDNLLPLHLIGKDTSGSDVDSCTRMRQEFVVRNIKAMLRTITESEISRLKEDCERNKNDADPSSKLKNIDSAVDVIQKSDVAWRKIKRAIDSEEDSIARRFGVKVDSFTLDDIGHPPDVVIQRDSTASFDIMSESARMFVKKTQDDNVRGEFTLTESLQAAQTQSGKIKQSIDTKKVGIETDTLGTLVKIVVPFTELLLKKYEQPAPPVPAADPVSPPPTPPVQTKKRRRKRGGSSKRI